jgi:hypothetical protein
MPRRKPYDQQALGWVTTHAEHRKWESKRERPIKNSLPPDALTTVRTRGALVGLGFLCGYLASRLKSPVRVRVNLDWNEEATSVRAVRRFTKLLGGGIEA